MWGKSKPSRGEQALKDRIALALISDPRWQVTLFETDWFCPFCGQVGVRSEPGRPLIDPIYRHLTTTCEVFAIQGGRELLSADEVKRRSHMYEVATRLEKESAWQCWDDVGNWFCPFCGEASVLSAVTVPPLPHDTISAVADHILGCRAYRGGGGEPLEVSEIERRIVQATAVRRLAGKVSDLMAEQSLWRVVSTEGVWACPYCALAVPGVVAGPGSDTKALSRDVARHLVRGCPGFQGKRMAVQTDGELRAAALGEVQLPPSEPEPARAVPSRLVLGTITGEMRLAAEDLARARAKEIEKDLAHAQRVQNDMLTKTPLFPGFSFDVLYRPCGHLAGDFYDFIEIDENRLGLVIGDVSGHGFNAALVVGMVKKVLNMAGRMHSDPAQAMSMANAEVSRDLPRGMFVTAWYGVFDRRERVLRCVRAGHEPAYRFNNERKPRVGEIKPPGLALGLVQGPKFAQTLRLDEVPLMRGDHLLLFTDGLAESKSPEGEEFGFERVQAVLLKYGASDPPTLIGRLDSISSNFRKGRTATDDLTLIAIKVDS